MSPCCTPSSTRREVAHVAFVDDGHPVNIPTAAARDGDRLLLHGSTGQPAVPQPGGRCRGLRDRDPLLDGMVLARSAFESSMHYRSGDGVRGGRRGRPTRSLRCTRCARPGCPGRWETLRPPHAKELAATMVLALPLDEWSVKVSDGPPTTTAGGPGRPGVGRRAADPHVVRRPGPGARPPRRPRSLADVTLETS